MKHVWAWALVCSLAPVGTGCDCGGGEETETGELRLDSVQPDSGPTAGGTVVELQGSGFREGIVVSFDGVDAIGVEVVAPSILRATTPRHDAEGLVDVSVAVGDEGDTLADGFEYVEGLRIDAITPASGSVHGGTAVIVSGAGFDPEVALFFGDSAATEIVFLDSETLNARTPAGAPGSVDVTVRNPDGQEDVLDDAFLYEVGSPCRVLSTTPGFGQTDVAIVTPIRIEWSEDFDQDTLEGAVTLATLDGEPVEVTLEADGERAVQVTPERSLRFWESYALSISDGVRSAGGLVQGASGQGCEPSAIAFSTVEPTVAPRELRPASARDVALTGDYAVTVSPTYRGLQVYDVSDPGDVDLVTDLPMDVVPLSISILGDRAYVPSGWDGVQIVDVSDPASPELIGRAGSPGYASDADPFERDDRLYLAIADGVEGVRLVDVTDAEASRDLGVIDPSGRRAADVRAVHVEGDLIAIANGFQSFAVASIADLASPQILGYGDTPSEVFDVLIDGNLLYVSQGYYGLRSFTLDALSNSATIATVDGPGGPCGFDCDDNLARLHKSGDFLFTPAGRSGFVRIALDGAGGMTLDGWADTPGYGFDVALHRGAVLVADEGGLVTFPQDAEEGTAPLWFDPSGHGIARSVALAGGRAYVAASTRGLQTFGLASPESPSLVDRDDTPGSLTADIAAYSVVAAPGKIVVGDGRDGIVLFDATDPDDPVVGGQLGQVDRVAGMVVQGDTLFACDDNAGLLIVDVSSSAEPRELARVAFADLGGVDQCYDLAARDDVLYMASREALTLVDIDDPIDPVVLGQFRLRADDAVVSVALSGSYLLATTVLLDYEARFGVTRRLQIFDITEPTTPLRVFISDDLGGAEDVEVAGDVAFVSARDLGVYVYDIHDPTEPVLEGLIETAGNAGGLAANGDALYVAGLEGGLEAVHTGPLPVAP